MESMRTKEVHRILKNYKDNNTALISILPDVPEEFGYLPAKAVELLSEKLYLNLIDIYAVATFYKSLRLTPLGKHNITVCTGTACHVRGTTKILDEIQSQLGIGPGDTSEDGEITFTTVNCLGVCAIGPVMIVDGKYYGRMNPVRVKQILSKYIKKRSAIAK